jgi:inorganic pyrophosphatase
MEIRALPAFGDDGSLRVVIESPRGATAKFKYDAESGVFTLSRALPSGLAYPYDWGFVPGTRGPDGDPLDAMILWDCTGYPGVVIPCRVIGMLRVDQAGRVSHGRERNDRILAVPLKAPRWDDVQDVHQVAGRTLEELERFFIAAVAFEGKDLRVLDWAGRDEALASVRAAVV